MMENYVYFIFLLCDYKIKSDTVNRGQPVESRLAWAVEYTNCIYAEE